MAFEVRYSSEAENDLDSILHWLIVERRAGQTGLRWFLGLEDKIATLAEMPQRCPVGPETDRLAFPFVICSMAASLASIASCSPLKATSCIF
jgi:plasmid stabilization system protein ParE